MTGTYFTSWMLLAQMDRFSGLRDRFSGPRARFGLDDALTAVGAIIAVSVVLYLVNRWFNRQSGRQSYNNSSAMFRELCKAHMLDRKTTDLLRRVARWQRLTQPARLFLEPERFEPVNLSPELEQHAAELFELRARLFTFDANSELHDLRPEASPVEANEFSEFSSVDATAPMPTAGKTETDILMDESTESIGAAEFATARLDDLTAPAHVEGS